MSNAGQFSGSVDPSLEHCYTNIFALTDFSGIQYRKYVLRDPKEYPNALCDPIIKSFSLCQQHNVLSAWVRSKKGVDNPNPCVFSKFVKELWVFWYGSGEFANANRCILPALEIGDRGNWRQGLSYEIRTVLFRALHNVLEKCLLSKGFVRLGRCFVQPYKQGCRSDYAQHSVSFSFFLHGESTVCASLDLCQHPAVQRVSEKHLRYCRENNTTIPVVLAPYGISAELTGLPNPTTTESELEFDDWSKFYPLLSEFEREPESSGLTGLPSFVISASNPQGSRGHGNVHRHSLSAADKRRLVEEPPEPGDSTPTFVQVIAGGFRLRYRFCYVLIPETINGKSGLSTGKVSSYTESPVQSRVVSKSDKHNVPSNSTVSGESRDSKSLTAWQFPNSRRKLHSSPRLLFERSRNDVLGFSSTLRADLLLDARRIYLAGRTLRRASQDNLIPNLSSSSKQCGVSWSGSQTNQSRICFTSSQSDNTSVPVSRGSAGDIFHWQTRGPYIQSECSCRHLDRPHAEPTTEYFHQNDPMDQKVLNALIQTDSSLFYSKNTPNSSPLTNVVPVGHDPSMPTLSPQQPISASGPALNCYSQWSGQDKLPSELRPNIPSKPELPHTTTCRSVNTSAPHLLMASHSKRLDYLRSDVNSSSIDPTAIIPQFTNGLINRSVSPHNAETHSKGQYCRTSPVVKIPKRICMIEWLADKASQERCCLQSGNTCLKRPALILDPADEYDMDDVHSYSNGPHKTSPVIDHSLMNGSHSPYIEDFPLNTKRARLTCSENQVLSDLYETNLDCAMVTHSSENVHPNIIIPDQASISPTAVFESMEVENGEENGLNISSTATDCVSATSLSGCSGTSLSLTGGGSVSARTALGLLPHGVSLASSAGSGHLGPKELARMLPTPPSHDAPQPSPVDGMAAVAVSVTRSSNAPPSSLTLTDSRTTSCTTYSQDPALLSSDHAANFHPCMQSSFLHLYNSQTLYHLARQPSVPSYNLLNVDPPQDWSFVRPWTSYHGMSSSYQMTMNDAGSFARSLPNVNWSFDHRLFNEKVPLVPTFVDVASASSINLTRHSLTPTCSVSQPTSWSPSTIACFTLSTCLSGNQNTTDQRADSTSEGRFHSPIHPYVLEAGSANLPSSQPKSVDHSSNLIVSTHPDEVSERFTKLRPASALLVNVILSDSFLNLFKDHNFDSCNICECTSSVLGAEIDIYLSNPTCAAPSNGAVTLGKQSCVPFNSMNNAGSGSITSVAFNTQDLTFKFSQDCTCGFSAVMNQKYVVNGNLFHEDEVEVTRLSILNDRDNSRSSRPYSVVPSYPHLPGWWAGTSIPSKDHLLLLEQLVRSQFDEFFVRFLSDHVRQKLLEPSTSVKENMLEYDDACALVHAALWESSKVECGDQGSVDVAMLTQQCQSLIHPSYMLKTHSKIPENHNDQIRLLTTLRPWLQEAISSTRLLESNYTVDGPLTWKAFHQLAGRGSDETCTPQPIPQLRVGSGDKENLLVFPFAVRDWDRLSLHPLSHCKQLAYAVVVPSEFTDWYSFGIDTFPTYGNSASHCSDTSNDLDMLLNSQSSKFSESNSPIHNALVRFFKEFSHAYENCHLGQHVPYHRPEVNCPETAFIPVRPFCRSNSSSDSDVSSCLRPDLIRSLCERFHGRCSTPELFLSRLHTYIANAFKCTVSTLAARGISFPASTTLSHSSIFNSFSHRFTSSPATNMNYIQKDVKDVDLKSNKRQTSNSKVANSRGNSCTNPRNGQGPLTTSLDLSPASDIYLVIYLVNPFTQFCDICPQLSRIVTQAFIGCAHHILSELPDSWQTRVNIQFLSLDNVLTDYMAHLRPMALGLYNSVDRLIEPSLINANRTLTGMGPAAEREKLSNNSENFHKRPVFAPAYTLVSSQDLWDPWDASVSDPTERPSVLFVAYCLSHNQQWLLATFTDERGSILDQTMINIQVPAEVFTDLDAHKKQGSNDSRPPITPRRIGLARLWDYIINLISGTSNPWRLVIGRVGRLGHGELKGWNSLLGRKGLQDVNRFFRDSCSTCNASASVPSTLSGNSSTPSNSVIKTMLHLVSSTSGANSCTHELPSLISACLVSLEPQSTFRIYPGVSLCSDGSGSGGSGGAGGGGSSSGGGTGGGGNANSGSGPGSITGALSGNTFSPYSMRTMMMVTGSSSTPTELPSTTHILVFPTSTSASGSSENASFADVISGMTQDDMKIFEDLDLNFESSDLASSVGLVGVIDAANSMGACTGMVDPTGGLLNHGEHDRLSDMVGLHRLGVGVMDPVGGGHLNDITSNVSSTSKPSDQSDNAGPTLADTMPFGTHNPMDEVANLMQQPIAMGYYISTAPPGPLPSWFWSACPQASSQYPVCFKSALHLQTSLVGLDDAVGAAASGPGPGTGAGVSNANRLGHLLDSTSTCDVLRYVLETYNALSWLTFSPVTNDRRTCLPIHILILSQLYQTLLAFV